MYTQDLNEFIQIFNDAETQITNLDPSIITSLTHTNETLSLLKEAKGSNFYQIAD
jgi:pyruvate formate-lyase activating enzyme-like uncharacterized protein